MPFGKWCRVVASILLLIPTTNAVVNAFPIDETWTIVKMTPSYEWPGRDVWNYFVKTERRLVVLSGKQSAAVNWTPSEGEKMYTFRNYFSKDGNWELIIECHTYNDPKIGNWWVPVKKFSPVTVPFLEHRNLSIGSVAVRPTENKEMVAVGGNKLPHISWDEFHKELPKLYKEVVLAMKRLDGFIEEYVPQAARNYTCLSGETSAH